MPTKLPGVFALINNGIETYKARFSVIFSIAVIQVVVMTAFASVTSMVGLANADGETISAETIKHIGGGTLGIFGLALALYMLILVLVSVAMLHAIRSAAEGVGVGEAFSRASRQFFAFIWVALITLALMLGAIVLLVALPAFVLLLLGFPSAVIAVLCVVLFVIVAVTIGTWFSFTNFVVLDDAGRGLAALAKSRELVQGRFMAVFGRVFGLTFLLGVLIGILSAIVQAILASLGLPQTVTAIVGQAITTVLFTPVVMGALYSLYANARTSTPVASTPSSFRTWAVALAILGVLAVGSLPLIGLKNVSSYLYLRFVPVPLVNQQTEKSGMESYATTSPSVGQW